MFTLLLILSHAFAADTSTARMAATKLIALGNKTPLGDNTTYTSVMACPGSGLSSVLAANVAGNDITVSAVVVMPNTRGGLTVFTLIDRDADGYLETFEDLTRAEADHEYSQVLSCYAKQP